MSDMEKDQRIAELEREVERLRSQIGEQQSPAGGAADSTGSGSQPYGQPYGQTAQSTYAANMGQQPYTGPQGQYGYANPAAASYAGPSTRHKDHVAAGLLGIFLGALGIHKFYLGYNTAGFIMLGVTLLGSIISFGIAGAVVSLIGFIEGIMYLVKGQDEFDRTYVQGNREWL